MARSPLECVSRRNNKNFFDQSLDEIKLLKFLNLQVVRSASPACAHARAHAQTHVCLHWRACARTNAHACTRAHTHTRVRAHARTNTRARGAHRGLQPLGVHGDLSGCRRIRSSTATSSGSMTSSTSRQPNAALPCGARPPRNRCNRPCRALAARRHVPRAHAACCSAGASLHRLRADARESVINPPIHRRCPHTHAACRAVGRRAAKGIAGRVER